MKKINLFSSLSSLAVAIMLLSANSCNTDQESNWEINISENEYTYEDVVTCDPSYTLATVGESPVEELMENYERNTSTIGVNEVHFIENVSYQGETSYIFVHTRKQHEDYFFSMYDCLGNFIVRLTDAQALSLLQNNSNARILGRIEHQW